MAYMDEKIVSELKQSPVRSDGLLARSTRIYNRLPVYDISLDFGSDVGGIGLSVTAFDFSQWDVIDGVLPVSLLEQCSIQINQAKKSVSLLPSDSVGSEVLSEYVDVPLLVKRERSDGKEIVTLWSFVQIPQLGFHLFLVDTGANNGVLATEYGHALALAGESMDTHKAVDAMFGEILTASKVRRVTLGGEEFERAVFNYDPTPPVDVRPRSNQIGMNLLGSHNWLLSLKRGWTLELPRVNSEPKEVSPDLHGMRFGTSNQVKYVMPGSPAAIAGIVASESIISVNGQPVDSNESVVELLQNGAHNERVQLGLRLESGKEKEVPIVFREYFEPITTSARLQYLEEMSWDSAVACVILGRAFERGWSGEKNPEKAAKWYRRGGLLSDPATDYLLAELAVIDSDFESALRYYLRACKSGLPEAHYRLAQLYDDRRSGLYDRSRALKHFAKCREQGFVGVVGR